MLVGCTEGPGFTVPNYHEAVSSEILRLVVQSTLSPTPHATPNFQTCQVVRSI